MAATDRVFPYAPNPGTAGLAVLFFGACAAFLADKAQSNDRGLIIQRTITLDRGEATTFYWVLVVASGLFVAFAIGSLIFFKVRPANIVVGEVAVTLPGSLFRLAPRTIAFASIRELSLRTINRQKFLEIRHDAGTTNVNAAMVEKASFDEISQLLRQRMAGKGSPKGP